MSSTPSETTRSIRLSTTSYVVLGMIALRGPSTSYDLKRAVARSLGYFWTFPHAQLYREPARLARAGLLREKREHGGRNRRVYSLTNAGMEELRRWLKAPVEKIIEIRDLAQLKLFCSELITRDDVIALAKNQEALHRRRLAEYSAIEAKYVNRSVPSRRRLAPLALGLMLEQAALRFWADIAENPPDGGNGGREIEGLSAVRRRSKADKSDSRDGAIGLS